ncbi:SOS-response transcriptional repressor LexA (RecA-mediated autopeptidase) [Paenacidovorax caeni]|uniref:SOS-response transcriptional repressor LexA (RecA-mediated autopeptidase) n=1 Tax=Paenacidovorax caeni TaxID=343013 RepID=A0A1I7KPJ9_9BURK|nr:SOS-response transcriptional repressor LexA (RecA-mediated autopeptidase) [Paenacidovorax caeni]
MTQPALAKKANVSQGTIGNIESGLRKRPRDLLAIAEALNVSPKWLETGDVPKALPTKSVANVEPGPEIRGRVPLISWVQAGAWCHAADPHPPGQVDRWMDCPVSHSPSSFALRVRGDSMTAPHGHGKSYPEGSYIFVDPERRTPVNGDRVVACLSGTDEVTFKVYKNEDGRQWLQPLNPAHEPIRDNFHIIGIVLGKWEDG